MSPTTPEHGAPEYTVAGSPAAVLRAERSDIIHILPLPGRTLDELEYMTEDQTRKLVCSLQAALREDEG